MSSGTAVLEARDVLGRNGAGKTTTMRSLMGLTAVREGSVHMLGQDTTRWPAYRIARLGV